MLVRDKAVDGGLIHIAELFEGFISPNCPASRQEGGLPQDCCVSVHVIYRQRWVIFALCTAVDRPRSAMHCNRHRYLGGCCSINDANNFYWTVCSKILFLDES